MPESSKGSNGGVLCISKDVNYSRSHLAIHYANEAAYSHSSIQRSMACTTPLCKLQRNPVLPLSNRNTSACTERSYPVSHTRQSAGRGRKVALSPKNTQLLRDLCHYIRLLLDIPRHPGAMGLSVSALSALSPLARQCTNTSSFGDSR